MPTTEDQRAAAEMVGDWAQSTEPVAAVRAPSDDTRSTLWEGLSELGVFSAAQPESVGGSGASVADLAAMLEAAAAALTPGPVLGTALASLIASDPTTAARTGTGSLPCAVAFDCVPLAADSAGPSGELSVSGDAGIVPGAGAGIAVLVPVRTESAVVWCLLDDATAGVTVEPVAALDHSRPSARVSCEAVTVTPDRIAGDTDPARVLDLAVTLGAAEASGVASWCLHTAVEYAKVREQFGKPIGSFQAVKALCARMLCRSEEAAAAAWDCATAAADDGELPIAAAVAAAVVFDHAVENAKDCIQVLGGIGFTWEHDAHFYLRRATALRASYGDTPRWRARVAALTRKGARRHLSIDLGDVASEREHVRAEVAAVASRSDAEQRAALAESGMLAPHWPAPYGRAASPRQQLLIDEELDAAGVERPDLVIGWWAVPTILEHGSNEQIERFVSPTLRGEIVWCQLFSEPGAGSDLASLRTVAERVDGGWTLRGQKVWTSKAHEADWAICLARTDRDVPKHKGIGYFLVDMTSPGITVSPLREITGDALFNEVFLDDVFVPDDMLVGAPDAGWRLARTTLANERVAMSGGSSVGSAVEQLYELAPDEDPVTDDELGRLTASAVVASVLDVRNTLARLAGQDPGAGSSVRKLVGVRQRQEVAELAMRLAGATEESPRTREFLNTRCLSIAGGTTQILETVAAERVLGLPRG
nr:acyl-CoA dehydrogenase [Rhodococcus sp. HNM0569]